MVQDSSNVQADVPLSGEIAPMSVAWLFQAIRIRSKTGTAIFEYVQEKTAAKTVKKVFFRSGDMLYAQSTLLDDRLSDQLLRAEKITRLQYDALSELIVKTGKKQGTLLVQLGFITPQDLIDGVKDQVKSIILSLFALRMGSYRFDEGPLPLEEIISLRMSTGNITLEGVNNLDWQAIRKSLPPPTTVIRPTEDPLCLFQDAQLTPDQRAVFSLVDGIRNIEEICGLAGGGDYNTLKAIYLLLALRMAEVGEIKSVAAEEDARSAVREAVSAPRAAQPATEAPPEQVVTRQSILLAHAAMVNQTHYELLGISRTASVRDIKRAYFHLAKAYHPDRHFDQTMADLKPTLEALFTRIHDAYNTLTDPAKRSEYDRIMAAAPATGEEFVEKRAEEYQENYREKAARAAVQFDFGMQEFRIGNYWGAEEKFAWACRMDPIKALYFFYHGLCLANMPRRRHEAEERLQKAIELDATKVEYHIELSNLYLKSGMKAKALGILNNALRHVSWTDKIQEAIAAAGEGNPSAVIYGEGKTEGNAPDGAIRPGGQPVGKEKAAQALEQFNRGMKEFNAKNFGLAVNSLAEAARLDPTKAEHHFYYGVALSRIARRQEEAEAPLLKAMKLDPTKVEYHLELGTFYLRNDQKAKALGVLNNALLHHPNAPRIREALKIAAGGAT